MLIYLFVRNATILNLSLAVGHETALSSTYGLKLLVL
jgi:hypothetical protein